MTGWTTAGLYDAHAAALRLCALPLCDFGGRIAFRGPVRTVRCRGDNTPVRAALAGRAAARCWWWTRPACSTAR